MFVAFESTSIYMNQFALSFMSYIHTSQIYLQYFIFFWKIYCNQNCEQLEKGFNKNFIIFNIMDGKFSKKAVFLLKPSLNVI